MRKRLVVLPLVTLLVLLSAGVGLFGTAWAKSPHPAGGKAAGRSAALSPKVLCPPGLGPAEMTASDGAANDTFGYTVAINGTIAVVGAVTKNNDTGAAYVFVPCGIGNLWSQQAELTASDGVSGNNFGYRVAVGGNTVIVGAPGDNSAAGMADKGAAYIFVRSGTTWTQQAELTASDGHSGDQFGAAVAVSLDGNTAVVTAPNHNGDIGAAYVFVRSGTTWTQQKLLTASDGAQGDLLGWSVALSGDGTTALVGAIEHNDHNPAINGAAYVFVRSGTTWSQQNELVASDPHAVNEFGFSVALSGDGTTALVGTPSTPSPDTIGAAWVFVRSGTAWSQNAKLTAAGGVSGDEFGVCVALSGDGSTMVVGANGNNNATGAAYVFVRNQML